MVSHPRIWYYFLGKLAESRQWGQLPCPKELYLLGRYNSLLFSL